LKVLLTGATGFIGKRILALLWQHGYDVTSISRGPKLNSDHGKYIFGDLKDKGFCTDILKNKDVIIHAAGEKSKTEYFWPVNVEVTKNLIAASIEEKVKRFVHISSVGVIGADPFLRIK